jgi:hypothetical protein
VLADALNSFLKAILQRCPGNIIFQLIHAPKTMINNKMLDPMTVQCLLR